MYCNTFFVRIFNRSAVYVKGFDPKKINAFKRYELLQHIRLWNIIVNVLVTHNTEENECSGIACNDILKYISENKALRSSISTNDLTANDPQYSCIDNYDEVICYIRMLVSKIDLTFFSKKCDYQKLFVYIRALHHLPKSLLSGNDKQKISAADAISYMKDELRSIKGISSIYRG